MATFTLEHFSDEAAILLTLHADYVAQRDLPESNPAVYALLEAVPEPVYYVIDPRRSSFSLEDMIQTASTTSRSGMSTFHHPNVRGVVVITADEIIRTALKGLNSEAFGYVKVILANDLDEAFFHIRQERAA